MTESLQDLPQSASDAVDLSVMLYHLMQLVIAYLLALPIAYNREKNARSAGFRTFPLVAVATCGYMLIGIDVLGDTSAASRIIVGIITGMGFIGGGAILKSGGEVSGTATAASLWNTGAIGLAVAWSRYEIAVLLCLLNFFTLQVFPSVKSLIETTDEANEKAPGNTKSNHD